MASTFSRLVLYINGVRFYPSAASVSASRNGFANFSVTLPAIQEWVTLPRRSHGALFFVDPVTRVWRLMCEGEYVGKSTAKSGEGHRSLSLSFEGLHACWQHTRLFNVVPSIKDNQQTGTDVTRTLQLAMANGIILSQVSKTGQALLSYQQIIDAVTAQATRVSAGLPAFIERVVGQTPVDSFYMRARRWLHKFLVLQDETLGETIDTNNMNTILKAGFMIGSGLGQPVLSLIQRYIDAAYYQMCPILAPPLYSDFDVDRIGEMLFTPNLAQVIPPASNVIFKDQISQQTQSVSYRNLPTRVISAIQNNVVNLPPYYMANGEVTENLLDIAKGPDPKTAMSHGFFSKEELENGIVSDMVDIDLSKVTPSQKYVSTTRPELMMKYLSHLTRYELDKRRGMHLTQNLVCEFMPYLITGFPCVVEDMTEPFTGVIENVTHMISATGDASTSVTVSYVREAYQIAGRNRTSFYPKYLNSLYLPAKISDTYEKLFGKNWMKHSAMLPGDEIAKQSNSYWASLSQGELVRCDLDELVG
ncbi:MAG TPA: hypothetical protein VLH09_09595, partial [Bryobacteraceae bacterium]|nr:hypothetical protein [Bryobacteraceae bacterium]